MAIERIVSKQPNDPDEVELEVTLRPKDFSNYIGQERIKKNLQLAITAAKNARKRWTTFYCTGRPDWEKPPWLV